MKENVWKKLKWNEKILSIVFQKYTRKIYIAGMAELYNFIYNNKNNNYNVER